MVATVEVALCLLVIVLDGFDMLVIALTAPAISADWALPAPRLGPVFAVASCCTRACRCTTTLPVSVRWSCWRQRPPSP